MRIRLTWVQVIEFDAGEPDEGQTPEAFLADEIKEGEEFPQHVFDDARTVEVRGEIVTEKPPQPLGGCPTCHGARHMRNDATGQIVVCWDCNAGGTVDKSLRPGKRWA